MLLLIFIHHIAWVVLALMLHQLWSLSTESLYIVLSQSLSLESLKTVALHLYFWFKFYGFKKIRLCHFYKKNQWLIGVHLCVNKLLRLSLYMKTFETVPYLWRSLCESTNRCGKVPHRVTEVLQVTLLGMVRNSSHRVSQQLHDRKRGQLVNPVIN